MTAPQVKLGHRQGIVLIHQFQPQHGCATLAARLWRCVGRSLGNGPVHQILRITPGEPPASPLVQHINRSPITRLKRSGRKHGSAAAVVAVIARDALCH